MEDFTMIRTILTLLFLIIYFLIGIPITGILYFIGKKNPQKKQQIANTCVKIAFTIILKVAAGTKITIIGKERIPKDTAVLYIGNHRGFFDILLIHTLAPGRIGFVAKKEMEQIPFLSTWMRAIHCLFLDRDDIKQGLQTILTGISYIKEGTSICIFPEGTRSQDIDESALLPFKEGSFKIAEKSGCPIIPVSMNHVSSILEDHFPWIKSQKVIIEFGEPIYPKELEKSQKKFLGAQIREIIRETIKKNSKLLQK